MKLSTANVFFSYNETMTLRNINIEFKPGRFYSILGPNGCGKTTLIDLLVGHRKPDSGSILLNGKSMDVYSRKNISKTIALVSQNHTINFPFTVEDVVMMGRHPYISRFSNPDRQDIAMVDAVMQLTGIAEFKHRKITRLSGGEQQRCVFARALCQDTPILLLDEAFSSMDIRHTLHLLNIIRKEVNQNNRTVISVFHDINIASAWSDHLIFMKQGEIAASGKTETVMSGSIIQDVFKVDAKVEYNPYVCAKQAYFKSRVDAA